MSLEDSISEVEEMLKKSKENLDRNKHLLNVEKRNLTEDSRQRVDNFMKTVNENRRNPAKLIDLMKEAKKLGESLSLKKQ